MATIRIQNVYFTSLDKEKATKFEKNLRSKKYFFQIFVAFSDFLAFNKTVIHNYLNSSVVLIEARKQKRMPISHGLWHSIHVVNSIFRKFPGNCTFRGGIKVFITALPYFWSGAPLPLPPLKKEGHSHIAPFEKKKWHSFIALFKKNSQLNKKCKQDFSIYRTAPSQAALDLKLLSFISRGFQS